MATDANAILVSLDKIAEGVSNAAFQEPVVMVFAATWENQGLNADAL